MQIVYTKRFISDYKKLPSGIKILAENRQKIFIKDPFAPTLKTHKLTGKLQGYWAFSINYKYRIIVKLEDKKAVWFLSVGTHNIYRRK